MLFDWLITGQVVGQCCEQLLGLIITVAGAAYIDVSAPSTPVAG